MSEILFVNTLEAVITKLRWEYAEFKKKPNYDSPNAERPYNTIGDWLGEYTGQVIEYDTYESKLNGTFYEEETYDDIIFPILEGLFNFCPPIEFTGWDNDHEKMTLFYEVRDELSDYPFSELEKEASYYW